MPVVGPASDHRLGRLAERTQRLLGGRVTGKVTLLGADPRDENCVTWSRDGITATVSTGPYRAASARPTGTASGIRSAAWRRSHRATGPTVSIEPGDQTRTLFLTQAVEARHRGNVSCPLEQGGRVERRVVGVGR